MASYCTISDVQNELDETYSTTSKPSANTVNNYIEQISAEINGKCKKAGYTVPVTTGDPLLYVKMTCIFGVCSRVAHTNHLRRAKDEPDQGAVYLKRYKANLQAIINREAFDESTISTGGVSSAWTESDLDNHDPVVFRGQKF